MNKEKNRVEMIAAAVGAAVILVAGAAVPMLRQENPADLAGWARPKEAAFDLAAAGPMTADEHVQTLLPTLFHEDAETRRTGLEALALVLDTEAGRSISEDTRDEAASTLIELYTAAEEDDAVRKRALRIAVTRVKGATARAFMEQALESEPSEMKVEALNAMLEPGALRGGDIDALAYELALGGDIPDRLRPAVMWRVKGRKAEADLIALFNKKIGGAALRETAVRLQDLHKPELMGDILSRLDEEGLLDKNETMPWFSGALLSKHISGASDMELIRALQVVWRRPSLTRSTFKAVEERLAHADPNIRRLAARLVPDAVKYASIDTETGTELLEARLKLETDPAVIGQIEGSLTEVRKTRRSDLPEPE